MSLMTQLGWHPAVGYGAMYALLGLSYYFLALAARKISIGVAFAFWEGFGVLLIAIVSVLFLNAELTGPMWAGIALCLVGMGLLHWDEEERHA
ncbi:spermidine export protein MdtJ [Ferrimonas marina]|uniref:Spermidine export protein MdtJ n=2 Tax=Ferrimonas marina TaxID=299255 RepID=A0A1M5VGV1_9GAMM|nr:spermidine export protein MdtJ [Ferrimonas marina]